MKICDCTLRDGGYYTNWDFDNELVIEYYKTMEKLPIDYVEIGYRSKAQSEYLGEYFYCPKYVLEQAKSLMPSKKLAIMLNEKDTQIEDLDFLLNPCKTYIDLVRMAVSPANIDQALIIAKDIKARGFKVAFNVMYMSKWANDPDMIQRLKTANGIVDYIYMVDSFGGVLPDEVESLTRKLKENVSCSIGFHGHNNLELGLANTLAAIKGGIDIVDATITGMGRGAGNLKTELLLTFLSSKQSIDVDFNALSDTVIEFENLQKQYQWGTNLPYMVSGANSLPQKDVMEWITQRFYSINSIIRALQNIKENIVDNLKLPLFNVDKNEKHSIALIIGGGTSAKIHANAIKQFIEKNKHDICLIHASSKNAKPYLTSDVPQYFCLVGNEGYRMEKVLCSVNKNNTKCILPSYPRKMGTYVPREVIGVSYELGEVSFSDLYQDSHFALALQTTIDLNVETVYIVGYDGYKQPIGEKEKGLINENNYLIELFTNKYNSITTLTNSEYKGFKKLSIFSLI